MIESNHAKGPWGLRKSETGPWAVFGANGNWIATTVKPQWPNEDLANARLISAAPDLLIALEAVLECVPPYLSNGDCTLSDRVTDLVVSAINKARGQV